MRGGIKSQCEFLFRSTLDAIGTSKHEAKSAAREQGASNWHEVGKALGIHSYATKDAYLDVWKQCFSFAREHFSIKDIEKLEGEHVQSFLQSKIEQGIKYSTFKQYASAIEKLEVALNRYASQHETGREYHFDLSHVREQAREALDHSQAPRAYENPREVIENLSNEAHRLAASIQLEGGARISEVQGLRAENLRGDTIHLDNTKGGRERDIRVSPETYKRLEEHITRHGSLSFDKDEYRDDVRRACESAGEEYHGSHGFRWNFAQEQVEHYQSQGYSYEEALAKTSEDMGHNREDITRHYLRVR